MGSSIVHMHSRVQQPCKFNGAKESVYIRMELNSHRIGLVQQNGCRFIALENQYVCHDVMCIRSIHLQQTGFHISVQTDTHLLCSSFLRLAIGLKELAPLIQPVRSNTKPNVIRWYKFSRAFHPLHLFAVRGLVHWIVQSDNFGFGHHKRFMTLIENCSKVTENLKSYLVRFSAKLLFRNFQYARKLGRLCCGHFGFLVEFYGLQDLKQTTRRQIYHNQRKNIF